MKNSTWLIIALFALGGFGFYYFNTNKQHSDGLKMIRNAWIKYIGVDKFHYQFSELGGVQPFDVPVQNNTDFIVDEIIVSVNYIKTSGEVYKTEKVTISNIPPHSIKSARAPESQRGTRVEVKIDEIISRSLHLCYPQGSGDYTDPYFCR